MIKKLTSIISILALLLSALPTVGAAEEFSLVGITADESGEKLLIDFTDNVAASALGNIYFQNPETGEKITSGAAFSQNADVIEVLLPEGSAKSRLVINKKLTSEAGDTMSDGYIYDITKGGFSDDCSRDDVWKSVNPTNYQLGSDTPDSMSKVSPNGKISISSLAGSSHGCIIVPGENYLDYKLSSSVFQYDVTTDAGQRAPQAFVLLSEIARPQEGAYSGTYGDGIWNLHPTGYAVSICYGNIMLKRFDGDLTVPTNSAHAGAYYDGNRMTWLGNGYAASTTYRIRIETTVDTNGVKIKVSTAEVENGVAGTFKSCAEYNDSNPVATSGSIGFSPWTLSTSVWNIDNVSYSDSKITIEEFKTVSSYISDCEEIISEVLSYQTPDEDFIKKTEEIESIINVLTDNGVGADEINGYSDYLALGEKFPTVVSENVSRADDGFHAVFGFSCDMSAESLSKENITVKRNGKDISYSLSSTDSKTLDVTIENIREYDSEIEITISKTIKSSDGYSMRDEYTYKFSEENYAEDLFTVTNVSQSADGNSIRVRFMKKPAATQLSNIYLTDLSGNKLQSQVSIASDDAKTAVVMLPEIAGGESARLVIGKNMTANDETVIDDGYVYTFTRAGGFEDFSSATDWKYVSASGIDKGTSNITRFSSIADNAGCINEDVYTAAVGVCGEDFADIAPKVVEYEYTFVTDAVGNGPQMLFNLSEIKSDGTNLYPVGYAVYSCYGNMVLKRFDGDLTNTKSNVKETFSWQSENPYLLDLRNNGTAIENGKFHVKVSVTNGENQMTVRVSAAEVSADGKIGSYKAASYTDTNPVSLTGGIGAAVWGIGAGWSADDILYSTSFLKFDAPIKISGLEAECKTLLNNAIHNDTSTDEFLNSIDRAEELIKILADNSVDATQFNGYAEFIAKVQSIPEITGTEIKKGIPYNVFTYIFSLPINEDSFKKEHYSVLANGSEFDDYLVLKISDTKASVLVFNNRLYESEISVEPKLDITSTNGIKLRRSVKKTYAENPDVKINSLTAVKSANTVNCQATLANNTGIDYVLVISVNSSSVVNNKTYTKQISKKYFTKADGNNINVTLDAEDGALTVSAVIYDSLSSLKPIYMEVTQTEN